MKYFKRLKVWKASNVSYNPETGIALSYNYWVFVRRVVLQGKVIYFFNDYRFSNSTSKHQSKVENLLYDEYKVNVYQEENHNGAQLVNVACYCGLTGDFFTTAINELERKKAALLEKINSLGTRKAKNEERKVEVLAIESKIKDLQEWRVRYFEALKEGEGEAA